MPCSECGAARLENLYYQPSTEGGKTCRPVCRVCSLMLQAVARQATRDSLAKYWTLDRRRSRAGWQLRQPGQVGVEQ